MIATDGTPTIANYRVTDDAFPRPISGRKPRCKSMYPGLVRLTGHGVRCEGLVGHTGQHGHSFAARYW